MSYVIYLFFDGKCDAAFEFYANALNGTIVDRTTYADAPSDIGFDVSHKNNIMHMSLKLSDCIIMGSDRASDANESANVAPGFAIALAPSDKVSAIKVFSAISEGGEIVIPLDDTFWGAYFGQCVDRFGVTWMVNVN